MPALFGSFDRPATQPQRREAAFQNVRVATLRSVPETKSVPTARKGPSGEARTGHRFAGKRATVGEKNGAGGVTHDHGVAVAIKRAAEALGIVMRQPVDQDRAPARRQGDVGRAGNLRAGKQHQRIGGHRQESVLADFDAGVLQRRRAGASGARSSMPGSSRAPRRADRQRSTARRCRRGKDRRTPIADRAWRSPGVLGRDRTAAWRGKGRVRAAGRASCVRRHG